VCFEVNEAGLQLYHPNKRPFVGFVELYQQLQTAEERIRIAEDLLEQERQRSHALLDRLQSLGISLETYE